MSKTMYKEPRLSLEEKTQAHLNKIKDQRFEDNLLKELSNQRFIEAKKRLKNFLVFSEMQDTDELKRLLRYFRSRYQTFVKLITEFIRSRKNNKAAKVQGTVEVDRYELKQAFILANKEQYVNYEHGQQDAIDQEVQAEIQSQQKKQKVQAMVYKVLGTYHSLRERLDSRGMVEHDWQPKFDKEKFSQRGWHFLYTTKCRDVFRMKLASFQYVNHILGAKALTTKVGLTHMMKNLIWQHDRDINETFPQSYDLTDLRSDETMSFREDFKFNQVISFVKQALHFTKKQTEAMREQIVIACSIVDRRVAVLSGKVFYDTNYQFNELDVISDAMYDYFKSGGQGDFRQAWYRPLMKHALDKDLQVRIKDVLGSYRELIGKKQFDLNIGQNAWILKPGGKSRGRGIEIHTDLEDLLKAIMVNQDSTWVVQKYIEKPLIIIGKKFDMRVWVLVTSVEPLTVYMFNQPYLRFTSDDYNANFGNKFSHLTNQSINKAGNQSKKKGIYKIKNNMWETHDFASFLSNEYSEVSSDPYHDIIVPQIKEGVIDSILAVKEVLHHRDRSHELFGYDFMVDADLNVWLIEVNSSPSMAYSTPITEKLVPVLMKSIVELVLDGDPGQNFDLIFK